MADYGKLIRDVALSTVGGDFFLSNSPFSTAYRAWLEKKEVKRVDPHAMYVTFVSRMAGIPATTIPNAVSTESLEAWFEKKERLFRSGNGFEPEPGDLIFFDPDISPENGVGIILDRSGKKISVGEIEPSRPGRRSGRKRSMLFFSESVSGYARPDYDASGSKPHILSGLVKPVRILEFNRWIHRNYPISLPDNASTVDSAMRTRFIEAWQREYNRITKKRHETSGVFGPKSRTLSKDVRLEVGSAGNMVLILRGMLYAHGYDPKGFHDAFDEDCQVSVEAIQRARRMDRTDGVVVPEVWDHLFNVW